MVGADGARLWVAERVPSCPRPDRRSVIFSATATAGATLLLSSCGPSEETAYPSRATREAPPHVAGAKMSDDPTARPGVEVFHPRPISGIRYDSSVHRLFDPATGDYLVIDPAHAGGLGQFTFGNSETGMIAYGQFRATGGASTPTVYEVIDLKTELGAAPNRTRTEFGIARIAELFRAYRNRAQLTSSKEVIVVDSRPVSNDGTRPVAG